MTQPSANDRDRLLDLLADREAFGLDDQEQAELDRLLAQFGGAEAEAMALALAAAAVDLSFAETAPEPLPADLAARLRASALTHQSPLVQPAAANAGRSARREWLAWLAAAACLLLALWAWRPWPSPPTLAEQRAALLQHGDTLMVPWQPTKDTAAGGDVVWNTRTQQGFMRFRGLAANDPGKFQYQLWIFDAKQDERYPVDGGVFDVDASTGDVIVPITPKLAIAAPTLFAITLEKPGGVVVSSRERLPLLAKVPSG